MKTSQVVGVLPDLVDDPLHPLLEVTPVAGPGHHAPQLELDHPLAGQRLRDVILHDALGDPFHDRGLAHIAGLADQHRVVLAAADSASTVCSISSSRPMRISAFPGPWRSGRGRTGPRRGGRPAAVSSRARRARRPWPASARCSASGVTRAPDGPRPRRFGVDGQREQDVLGPDMVPTLRGPRPAGPVFARGQLRRLAAALPRPGLLRLDLTGDRLRVGPAPGHSWRPGGLAGGGRPARCSVSRSAPPPPAARAARPRRRAARLGALVRRVMSTPGVGLRPGRSAGTSGRARNWSTGWSPPQP